MICQSCSIEAPTRNVTFHRNIGALVVRYHRSIGGAFCKRCIHKHYWQYTGLGLTLGWWGTISFVLTIVYFVQNTVEYFGCASLAPVPAGAAVPQLTTEAWERIQQHHYNLARRLQAGQQLEAAAQEVAMAAGVSPGQVVLYVRNINGGRA